MSDLQQRIAAARHRVAVDVTPDDVADALTALHTRVLRRRRLRLGAGAALLVATAAVVAGRRDRTLVAPSAPALVASRSSQAPVPARQQETAAAPLVYGDGSRATPLAPRSKVQLLEQRTALVRTRVVFGGGRFEVAKDPRRRFQVLAGPLVVEAIGTVFTVERAPEDVWVSVEEGRVRVNGPGVAAELDASERRRFRDVAVPPAAPVTPQPPGAAAPPRAADGAPEPARPHQAPPSLQPPPVAPEREDDIDRGLRGADQARAAGQYGAAAAMLRAVTQRTHDARAPIAGFTLGRLLLEKLDQPAEAARAFAEVQRLAPEGDLAEDALAREVESWRAAGLTGEARARARTYLQRYPQGRRTDDVRRLGGLP